MKKGIHPKVYTNCLVTCACGNSFTTISTLKEIKVDICSNCHPLFTGQQKFVDTEGRIDKFNRKLQRIDAKKTASKAKKTKTTGKAIPPKKTPSLKDLLEQSRK